MFKEEFNWVVWVWVVNLKWIVGMKCYGYKGVFELVVMVDYLCVFDVISELIDDY